MILCVWQRKRDSFWGSLENVKISQVEITLKILFTLSVAEEVPKLTLPEVRRTLLVHSGFWIADSMCFKGALATSGTCSC